MLSLQKLFSVRLRTIYVAKKVPDFVWVKMLACFYGHMLGKMVHIEGSVRIRSLLNYQMLTAGPKIKWKQRPLPTCYFHKFEV